MKCWKCNSEMETERENARYDALPTVMLVDVPVHECRHCGERQTEIPNLEGLNEVLAKHLVELDRHFTGQEVRFLRKYLNKSGRELAETMGVQPETVSRWQNGKATMNEQAERLLRMLVAEDTSIVERFPKEFKAPAGGSWLKANAQGGEWRAA